MSVRRVGAALAASLLLYVIAACGPTGVSGGQTDGPVGQPDSAVKPPQYDAAVPWDYDSGRPPPCDPDDPSHVATPEECDSIDNDCNGVVDDNVAPRPNPVGCGVQVCQLGQWVDAPPEFATEVCNNCDDDGDGCVDGTTSASGCVQLTRQDPSSPAGCPMIQRCISGQWVNDGQTTQGDEVCDGIDNDCNGIIDDIDPTPCGLWCGGVPNVGIWVCQNGQRVCKPNGIISIELCDGKDNDCDGIIDEGVPPEPCACGTGQMTCQNGHMTGNCATSCVEGTYRWCDDPQKCHWGRQQCVRDPDGQTNWGDCVEVTDRPVGCEGQTMYDPNCCDQAGECCQDAFHSWQSCGHCEEQCQGQTYTPCT